MSGFENLPPGQGCVIAANHIGRLDAALAYYVLDRPDIIMVVAEKYEKYAFFRWLVRITNGMFIDRYNADIGAIRATLRRLEPGPDPDHHAGRHALEIREPDPGQTGRDLPGLESGCAHPAGRHYRLRRCRRKGPPQAFQPPAYQSRGGAGFHFALRSPGRTGMP